MIDIKHTGDFSKTITYLNKAIKNLNFNDLDKYGEEGVELLSKNTPIDTGLTASSWSYKIEKGNGKTSISWYNSNNNNGVPIAVILQYGHATGNGGWVAGRDYINPAMRPLFDKIAEKAWREVNSK